MKNLLIVFHSTTGGARQMAEAAARGASAEPGVRVRLLRAAVAGAEDVLQSDGYVFVTPENLAAISGIMKDFFDPLRALASRPAPTRCGAAHAGAVRRQRLALSVSLSSYACANTEAHSSGQGR